MVGSYSRNPHTSFRVALEAQHNLWRSVPSRGNILSHIAGILLGIDREATSKAEITDFQLAIGIHKQIARLQVSVENVGGVDVLEAAEDLVNKGLEVGICKWLAGTDDSRQVALHQFYMKWLVSHAVIIQSTCPASVGDCPARSLR